MRQHLPFFRYVAIQLVTSLSLVYISVSMSPKAYAYGYWIGELLDAAMLFWLIATMVRETFVPHKSLPSGVLTAFAFGVSMFMVAAISLLFRPAKAVVWWMTWIRIADRSCSVMLCGLLMSCALVRSCP